VRVEISTSLIRENLLHNWTKPPRSEVEISAISDKMSTDLVQYSIPSTNQDRKDHLRAVCRLGAELRGLISLHPSNWQFGGWDQTEGLRSGFITVFPQLLKEGQPVGQRDIIRV